MKYLLDTCLLSELVRKKPNIGVVRWFERVEESTLYLSSLTIGELQKGISKLPDNPRKEKLQAWVSNDLVSRFDGRILDIDTEVATAWGVLQGTREQKGVVLPAIDSLIAATAMVHKLTVVTRNTKDIERCHVKAFNPWE